MDPILDTYIEPDRPVTDELRQSCIDFLDSTADLLGRTTDQKLQALAAISPQVLLKIVEQAHHALLGNGRPPFKEDGDGFVYMHDGRRGSEITIAFLPPMDLSAKEQAFEKLTKSINRYAKAVLEGNQSETSKEVAVLRIASALTVGTNYIHLFPDGNGRTSRLLAASLTGHYQDLQSVGATAKIGKLIESIVNGEFKIVDKSDAINAELFEEYTGTLLEDNKDMHNEVASMLYAIGYPDSVYHFLETLEREPVRNYFLKRLSKEQRDLDVDPPLPDEVAEHWKQAQLDPVNSIINSLENPTEPDILRAHGLNIEARIRVSTEPAGLER